MSLSSSESDRFGTSGEEGSLGDHVGGLHERHVLRVGEVRDVYELIELLLDLLAGLAREVVDEHVPVILRDVHPLRIDDDADHDHGAAVSRSASFPIPGGPTRTVDRSGYPSLPKSPSRESRPVEAKNVGWVEFCDKDIRNVVRKSD